jgi:hypothetical protein
VRELHVANAERGEEFAGFLKGAHLLIVGNSREANDVNSFVFLVLWGCNCA